MVEVIEDVGAWVDILVVGRSVGSSWFDVCTGWSDVVRCE